MLAEWLAGVAFGLSAGLMPGPLLTLVIAQTLRYNAAEGMKVALSPLVTDIPIVLGSLFVLSRLTSFGLVMGAVSLVGALYVSYLARATWQSRPSPRRVVDENPRSLRKGALANFLNPHPYLFWATVGAPFIFRSGSEWLVPAAFLVGFYVCLVGSKVSIAFMVGKSRNLLNSKWYAAVMKTLAVALFFLAVLLFRDGLTFLGVVC
jgi:threonine/homoserine/homoserine lactone efflux protein